MPIFRVAGVDAAGERFERRRFEAVDESALGAMLAGHGVHVEHSRRVALTRWPFVRHGWPILIWPLLAFFALGAAARLVATVLVLWAVHTERPLYEQLATVGQVGEATVATVRADKRGQPFEWAYSFDGGGGRTVSGLLQRGFGAIRDRRFDVTLAGFEPEVGQRFAVTFLAGQPEVHVPGRVGPESLVMLREAVRTVLWQGLLAFGVGITSIWGVRNILLRLGSHYWMDDEGTVIEYAGRNPVKLRIDLEARDDQPEDDG